MPNNRFDGGKPVSLSGEKYGVELATRIADILEKGFIIENTHRDYCGLGMGCFEREYIVFSSYDGIREVKVSFKKKKDFIDFLKEQSDYSFSGECKECTALYEEDSFNVNNQRITKKRLHEALRAFAGR